MQPALGADAAHTALKCGEYTFRGRLKSGGGTTAQLQLPTATGTYKRVAIAVSGLTPDEVSRYSNQYVELRGRVDVAGEPDQVRARITRVVGSVPRAKALDRPVHFIRKIACLPPKPHAKDGSKKTAPAPAQKAKKSSSSRR
jgi:hypothetical protein